MPGVARRDVTVNISFTASRQTTGRTGLPDVPPLVLSGHTCHECVPMSRSGGRLLALATLTTASGCAVDLKAKFEDICVEHHCHFDYVCDETVPWLHHSKASGSWAAATPPDGTGCHAYTARASKASDPRHL